LSTANNAYNQAVRPALLLTDVTRKIYFSRLPRRTQELSAAGLGSAAYLVKTGEEKVLWVSLLYFTAMKLLQGFNYMWLGKR
jgi:hypothetical protein